MSQTWLLFIALVASLGLLAEPIVWSAANTYGKRHSATVASIGGGRGGQRVYLEIPDAEKREFRPSMHSTFWVYKEGQEIEVLWIEDTDYVWPADGLQYFLASNFLLALLVAFTAWVLWFWRREKTKLS